MPKRICLSRAKDWRKPEGTIVVTRGPGRAWGNPFEIISALADKVMPWRVAGPDRNVSFADKAAAQTFAVASYKDWLARPEQAGLVARMRVQVRGHDVGCACKLNESCHGDVILDVANAPDRAG